VGVARALRADAERNRQRLLEAAAELFAAKGLSVGLDEIARHAGVGVGTAYRRFPDKAQLIDALFEDLLEQLVTLAEEGLAADDPWAGFVSFMEGAVGLHTSNRGVKDLMFSEGYAAEFVGRARLRLAPLVQELVRRAQASGDLRADVDFTDMPLIQFLVSSVGEFGGPHTAGLWRRYLAIVLDGLRTPEPRPLAPPALTLDAFAQTIASTSR
jgi:AcrR family transcriptional regulator